MVAGVFDIGEMNPGKNFSTDYVAQYSPYAVMVAYDDQKHLQEIRVVRTKGGVEVTGISDKDTLGKIVDRYEVTETSSSLIFILYNIQNEVINQYEFDTNKGQWVN